MPCRRPPGSIGGAARRSARIGRTQLAVGHLDIGEHGVDLPCRSPGSEAYRVIEHFNTLPTQEQQNIINFLRSL